MIISARITDRLRVTYEAYPHYSQDEKTNAGYQGRKANLVFAHFTPEGGQELLAVDPTASHAAKPERDTLEGFGPPVDMFAERPLAFLDSNCHVIQSS